MVITLEILSIHRKWTIIVLLVATVAFYIGSIVSYHRTFITDDLLNPMMTASYASIVSEPCSTTRTDSSHAPSQPNTSADITRPNASSARETFKIIVLTMDRFASLERLIRSLQLTDYLDDTVDLIIRFDRPKKPSDDWQSQIETIRSQWQWRFGRLSVIVATENMGLRKAWLSAWQPSSTQDRAIILEDDIEVSPLWYRWVKKAYDAYGNRTDMAGMSLQHQSLVPQKLNGANSIYANGGYPFLYKLVGSIGYIPMASVWMDFLDFAECALVTAMDVSTPQLITSDWYKALDQRSMWTQLFIFFCDYRNLYTLYVFPSDSLALAAHWREKGEHFGKTEGRDFEPVGRNTPWTMNFPRLLLRLDWDARPSVPITTNLRTLVLSAAVGFKLEDFDHFITSLRTHYSGDVALLVSDKASKDINDYLAGNSIWVVRTAESGGPRDSPEWNKLNRLRWYFFQDTCREGIYDLCMAIDFRDALFQDDPFRGMAVADKGKAVLHLYQHNLVMNLWHLNIATNCMGHNEVIQGKMIINAGGIVASPPALAQLTQWITEKAKGCDDQVALNLAVYGNKLNADIILYPQGQGNVNNVGWDGKFRRDSRRRFLNSNCFPAPVAHSYDVAKD